MKVTCPRCGEPGYLTRVRVGKYYYLRVDHMKYVNGRIVKRVCYLGKDTSELAGVIDEIMGDGSSRNNSSRKILWFPGGDYYIAEDILLPRIERLCRYDKCTFVEVFGGSGYVSQIVSREIFGSIVYNDIDKGLVTLFKHIKENPEQLAYYIALMPYSREYYTIVRSDARKNGNHGSLADAVVLFYDANTVFLGGFAKEGFAYAIQPNRNEARAFRARAWAIVVYADAWKDVTIENLDFRDVIRKYDSEKTVFYLDPPYPDRSVDYYGHPFTVDDLREMAKILTEIQGKFLLKLDARTYEPISDILPEGKYRVEKIERKLSQRKVKGGQKGTWVLTLVSNPH